MAKYFDCPHCGEQMKIFHDPETTLQNLKKKLMDKGEGIVSLLRNSNTNKIVGFAFMYGCTLQEEFEYEWGNKYNYMAEEDQSPEYDRSFYNFLHRLREAFPDADFGPETEVFCWNCMATAPEARGQKHLAVLLNNLFYAIPPENKGVYVIGEAERGSKAHIIFQMAGCVDVERILEGNNIIVGGTVEDGLNFRLPPEEFAKLKKNISIRSH